MDKQYRIDEGPSGQSEPRRPTSKFMEQARRDAELIEGLSRDQAIQTVAIGVRNDIVRALREPNATAESVASTYRLHGDRSHHQEIVEEAYRMEGSKRREEPHRVLQHTLDLLWERTKKKDDQPVDIDALRARIMAGGTLRENNTDLTESQWEELLSGLTSDEHRELVEGMRLTNLTLRKKLDEHPKFRDMQNANAFKRDFDASKSPGAFVFFDLINFKNLNSRYSYSFVDEVVLQNLCSALKAGLPAGSLIAIKGGDEFMIKIPAIAAGAETERVLELLGRNNQRSPSDAWILSPRDASALVAAIVKRSMESLPTSTIAHGQRHLVHKQKGIVGTATDLLSTYVLRRNPNDPALQAAKTAGIQSDVSRVHGKIAALSTTTEMKYEEAERLAVGGLKSIDTRDNRANKRFPSTVVDASGRPEAAFSATGETTRDFFLGAGNDLKDFWGRLTR